MTLIELLVAIVLIGVVSALVTGAVTQLAHVLIHNDDENQGQQDAKIIMERLGRDVREARGVVCDAPANQTSPSRCADHLQLWVDSNSDYLQQDDEIITWRVVESSTGEHFDVLRTVGLGSSAVTRTEARSLIVGAIFSYDAPQPEDAHVVTVDLTYDALVGVGTNQRQAQATIELRNR